MGRFIIVISGHSHKTLLPRPSTGRDRLMMPWRCTFDENAANNRPDNLRWGTQKENLNAEGFLTYCRGRVGENNPFVKGRRE